MIKRYNVIFGKTHKIFNVHGKKLNDRVDQLINGNKTDFRKWINKASRLQIVLLIESLNDQGYDGIELVKSMLKH